MNGSSFVGGSIRVILLDFATVARLEQGAPAPPVGLRGLGPLGLSLICSPKTHTSYRRGRLRRAPLDSYPWLDPSSDIRRRESNSETAWYISARADGVDDGTARYGTAPIRLAGHDRAFGQLLGFRRRARAAGCFPL